jgi:hypothetical protein
MLSKLSQLRTQVSHHFVMQNTTVRSNHTLCMLCSAWWVTPLLLCFPLCLLPKMGVGGAHSILQIYLAAGVQRQLASPIFPRSGPLLKAHVPLTAVYYCINGVQHIQAQHNTVCTLFDNFEIAMYYGPLFLLTPQANRYAF